MFHLNARVFFKWTLITWLCGGYSFFLGLSVTKGTYIPMLLGMLTLILMFTLIESHPRYQAARSVHKLLALALDLGVKIRCVLGCLLLVSVAISTEILTKTWLSFVFFLPQIIDVFIGVWTVALTKMIFGFDLSSTYAAVQTVGQVPQAPATFAYWFATYFTTITTGLAHTLILAVLCGLIYGILRLKGLGKSNVSP